jgi:predicted Zn-dependent protease
LINPETLALVIPPPYVPLQTRGGSAASSDAFAAAMTKYAAKDYRGAVTGLKAVTEAQPDAVHAQFFLGISYLVLGEPADASAVLNRVAGSNVAPFADEAHFYLAKAALRAHDLDRAERELSLATERQAGPPNEAPKLLQALRLYRRDSGQN